MAIEKFANAELLDTVTVNAWERMFGKQSFRTKTASVKKVADEQSQYLLTHASIMASVHCEDQPRDFLIRPESSIFVNQNEDAWENDVLKLSYRSFVGAFNFLEHYQNTKANKGHILDSILRKVKLTPEVFVYFVDLLVATDLAHTELITDIREKKMKYMSMGCLTDIVICSFCGKRCTDASTYCAHLRYRKGEFLLDSTGTPRRVAELCGHKSLPNGGVKFVEASWVHTPAFAGAASRAIIMDGWKGPKSRYTHQASLSGMAKTASSGLICEPVTAQQAAEFRGIL